MLQKDEIYLFVVQDAEENACWKLRNLKKTVNLSRKLKKNGRKWDLKILIFLIIRQRIVKKMPGESVSDT